MEPNEQSSPSHWPHWRSSRRSALSGASLAALALILAARPAHAKPRIIECVADLGVS